MIGLFAGILVGELIRRHKEAQKIDTSHISGSLKAATAGVLGSFTAIIIDFCLAVLFIGLFIYFVIK